MTLKSVLNQSDGPCANSISLIPRSGIQFLDFGIDSRSNKLPKEWGCYDQTGKSGLLVPESYALAQRDGEQFSRDAGRLPVKYSITLKEVLGLVMDRWLPLPLLRRDGAGFRHGPSNWARGRLVALGENDRHGFDYHLILAIDTQLVDFVEGRPYLGPSQGDAEAGLPFALANQFDPMRWFLGEEWIGLWVAELFREMLERRQLEVTGRRRADPITEQDVAEELAGSGRAEPLLRYAAFIDLIERAEVLPQNFRLIDTVTERRMPYIPCDLVLDIGNSRTCGLLIEDDPDRGSDVVSRAATLEIRDLGAPHQVYIEPFESRIEFARASFGKAHLSQRSGRVDAFEWPTLTRIGHEAARLTGQRLGNEGNTGMSSPKRYLWSTDAPAHAWRFNQKTIQGDHELLAVHGTLAGLVNDFGTPLHLLDVADPDKLPAMSALYSRSNLFSFALAEILLHALTTINSPDYRLKRSNAENPRRLRRIVMTMPSALPLEERAIMRRRAEAARDLIYLALKLARLGSSDANQTVRGQPLEWYLDGIVEPGIVLQWDEASATQVVYLYTQVVKNFAGHAPDFFNLMRQPDNPVPNSLRIATIDIGGGTTDLVITSFTHEGDGNAVTIFPNQLFREGFSLAGDDIVRQVIAEHVLPPIEQAAEAAGAVSGPTLTGQLFGSDDNLIDASSQVRRQQFAIKIAAPIAIAMLSRFEETEQSSDTATKQVHFGDFFEADSRPTGDTLKQINSAFQERGCHGFDLRNISFPVNFSRLERTIRAAIGEVLAAMAEVVWHYRTDLLLVSGRPSRLPAIQRILTELLPMYAGRILPMHQFPVGGWYPFREELQSGLGNSRLVSVIKDPKTTAAVGAMICTLGQGGIEGFNFRADLIARPHSTARYIGRMDGRRLIPSADTYYADLNLSDFDMQLPDKSFEFRGIMTLGFRQFPNDWWPATPLYRLNYRDEDARRKMHEQTPIKVRLQRVRRPGGDGLGEALEIAEAHTQYGRSAREALTLKLQTLSDAGGYWLDTGVLKQT